MADNVGYTPGSGATIATREIAYSGQTAQAQAVGLVNFSGTDDAKVGRDIGDDNPLQTQEISGATSLLNRILAVLMSPMGYDRSLSRQRVTAVVESGTVTTVTTVTTVSGLTNIDGRNGAMLINQTNLSAWADCHRARIT